MIRTISSQLRSPSRQIPRFLSRIVRWKRMHKAKVWSGRLQNWAQVSTLAWTHLMNWKKEKSKKRRWLRTQPANIVIYLSFQGTCIVILSNRTCKETKWKRSTFSRVAKFLGILRKKSWKRWQTRWSWKFCSENSTFSRKETNCNKFTLLKRVRFKLASEFLSKLIL